jgi:Ice-binding-like
MRSSHREFETGAEGSAARATPKRRRVVLFVLAVAGVSVLALGGTAWAVPTPVGLGSATNAAVSAGAGVTNSGISTVAGDLDTSPSASQTGVACPAANCVVFTTGTANANNGVASGVAADTRAAYVNTSTLDGATAIGAQLGNIPGGDTAPTASPFPAGIPAGLYSTGAAAITGTLTLNAQNDPNSVWIFQAASSITGETGSNVVFTNIPVGSSVETLSCNVFWTAVSSATLNGATFVGTVLANTSITLGAGVNVTGRLLAGPSGDVTMITDTINRPSCTQLPAGTGGTPASTGGGSGATPGAGLTAAAGGSGSGAGSGGAGAVPTVTAAFNG